MKETVFRDYLLAANPKTSGWDLIRLARSPDYTVRRGVAENVNCPSELLVNLSSDDHSEVRSAAVLNPNALRGLLYAALNDPDPDVRYEIAEDPNVNIDVLFYLTRDSNPYVSQRAQKSLNHKCPSNEVRSSYFAA